MSAAKHSLGLIFVVLTSLIQTAWAEQNVAFATAAVGRNGEYQRQESSERNETQESRDRDETQESRVKRYPDYWYPIREESKPEPRTTWAQDGYLFKHTF
jgi:hypothetical protein